MLVHSWLQRWVSHSFTSAGKLACGHAESSRPSGEGRGPRLSRALPWETISSTSLKDQWGIRGLGKGKEPSWGRGRGRAGAFWWGFGPPPGGGSHRSGSGLPNGGLGAALLRVHMIW